MAAETKIPNIMDIAAVRAGTPKIIAATAPLHAPVKGKGTATNINRAKGINFQ